MSVIRITKQFRFEMAHALLGYDGPCRNIHGHSYELFVTLSGEPVRDSASPKNGMLMDFGDLKCLVKKHVTDIFDHSLVLNREMPEALLKPVQDSFDNVLLVDYQPTSENFLVDFADRIRKHLPEGVKLHSLKLQETITSYAEWFAAENA